MKYLVLVLMIVMGLFFNGCSNFYFNDRTKIKNLKEFKLDKNKISLKNVDIINFEINSFSRTKYNDFIFFTDLKHKIYLYMPFKFDNKSTKKSTRIRKILVDKITIDLISKKGEKEGFASFGDLQKTETDINKLQLVRLIPKEVNFPNNSIYKRGYIKNWNSSLVVKRYFFEDVPFYLVIIKEPRISSGPNGISYYDKLHVQLHISNSKNNLISIFNNETKNAINKSKIISRTTITKDSHSWGDSIAQGILAYGALAVGAAVQIISGKNDFKSNNSLSFILNDGSFLNSGLGKFKIQIEGDASTGYFKKEAFSEGGSFNQTDFSVLPLGKYKVIVKGIKKHGKEIFKSSTNVRLTSSHNHQTCTIDLDYKEIDCR
ncbi:MAG: Unknown protein [uncultured Sulfurovum sp.]|uniref:Uncharacterized protein n=1 Tax=uncultured Sulfurovum sp. TaxID=269237 RepID=A0A6S6T0U3_9BACT|nr:MAG: Unknown protein [uncultured Sulfurovum sp.]